MGLRPAPGGATALSCVEAGHGEPDGEDAAGRKKHNRYREPGADPGGVVVKAGSRALRGG